MQEAKSLRALMYSAQTYQEFPQSGAPQRRKCPGVYKSLRDEVWEISLLPPDPSWKFTG